VRGNPRASPFFPEKTTPVVDGKRAKVGPSRTQAHQEQLPALRAPVLSNKRPDAAVFARSFIVAA